MAFTLWMQFYGFSAGKGTKWSHSLIINIFHHLNWANLSNHNHFTYVSLQITSKPAADEWRVIQFKKFDTFSDTGCRLIKHAYAEYSSGAQLILRHLISYSTTYIHYLISDGVKNWTIWKGVLVKLPLTRIRLIAATISTRLLGRATSRLPMYCRREGKTWQVQHIN